MIANVIGNQCVWFCAVAGAGRGLAWPGVVAAAGFVAWQVAIAPLPRGEMKLVALAVLLGLAVDGLAGGMGWVVYAAQSGSSWLAPTWILGLWAAFAVMLTVSLRALQGHLLLAAALGALGIPLAYLGAARGWEAVALNAPAWHGLAWLALAWALALPVMLYAARCTRTQTSGLGPRNEGTA